MKTTATVLLAAICACGCRSVHLVDVSVPPEPPPVSGSFIIKGMTKGLRREVGKGFHTVDVPSENAPDHWEQYNWSRDLYYHNLRLGEADGAAVSPSGRYGIFQDYDHYGIVLFDTETLELFEIPITWATLGRVALWDEDNGTCVVVYRDRKHVVRAKRVPIRELKRVKKWQNKSMQATPNGAPDG